jgi:hypothetical protein
VSYLLWLAVAGLDPELTDIAPESCMHDSVFCLGQGCGLGCCYGLPIYTLHLLAPMHDSHVRGFFIASEKLATKPTHPANR